jgi:hypothetical protein
VRRGLRENLFKNLFLKSQVWWQMPVIPVFLEAEARDNCEFEANLGYMAKLPCSHLKTKQNKIAF